MQIQDQRFGGSGSLGVGGADLRYIKRTGDVVLPPSSGSYVWDFRGGTNGHLYLTLNPGFTPLLEFNPAGLVFYSPSFNRFLSLATMNFGNGDDFRLFFDSTADKMYFQGGINNVGSQIYDIGGSNAGADLTIQNGNIFYNGWDFLVTCNTSGAPSQFGIYINTNGNSSGVGLYLDDNTGSSPAVIQWLQNGSSAGSWMTDDPGGIYGLSSGFNLIGVSKCAIHVDGGAGPVVNMEFTVSSATFNQPSNFVSTVGLFGNVTLGEGINAILGTTTGTKWGTSTTQKQGWWNATPVVQRTGWGSITNVTTDRSYDANATTVDELADVLGTLIADIRTYGLLGT